MTSNAKTVDAYLKEVPEDRRETLTTLRNLILKNLPKGYEESMTLGMPTYEVPLSRYPDTYNKKPLAYAGLASQKNYMALYLMSPYMIPELRTKLEEHFKKAGKKLDMGLSCLRFKKLEDLPLDILGEIIAAVPVGTLIAAVEASNASRKSKS